jgi:bacterioferritin-associated ferredoxin
MAIACSCHGIRDHDLRAAIHDGAGSVDDVMEACGAGTDCGGCLPTIEALLALEGAPERASGSVRSMSAA